MRASGTLALLQAVMIGPAPMPAPDPAPSPLDINQRAECPETRPDEIVVCKRSRPNSSPRLPPGDVPANSGLLDNNGRFRLKLSDKATLGGGGSGESLGLNLKIRF